MEEALALLSREGVNTAVLAGGTQLTARLHGDVEEVIDLQAVGLDEVTHSQERMACGAMVRLQTIVDDEEAPDLLREMARREGPNTFRNAGTVGGAIAAGGGENEFLAALLVHEAQVTVETPDGTRRLSLAQLLADLERGLRGGILAGVALDTRGATAHDRVARTPADSPIVAAVARRPPDDDVRLALCGVADVPVLVNERELDALQPPSDFRGSSDYRREMAKVLAARVLQAVEE
jgi:carbon-monoxide dehydrogenase medium subunit